MRRDEPRSGLRRATRTRARLPPPLLRPGVRQLEEAPVPGGRGGEERPVHQGDGDRRWHGLLQGDGVRRGGHEEGQGRIRETTAERGGDGAAEQAPPTTR